MKGLNLLPLLVVAPSIFAAMSTDLNVGGQITPTSCDVSISDGNFALGDAIVLNPTGNTTLTTSAAQTMSLICSGSTYVGFRGSDNRAGTSTSTGSNAYGLGTDALGNKIGWYKINMTNAIANGATGYMKYTFNDGTSWTTIGNSSNVGDLNHYAGQHVTYAINSSNNGAAPPDAITSAAVNLSVTPTIAPRNTLDTSSAINLDGSATVELVYL